MFGGLLGRGRAEVRGETIKQIPAQKQRTQPERYLKMDTGCDMSQEELLAMLKGISGGRPPSPKTTEVEPQTEEEPGYMAPPAKEVQRAYSPYAK